MENTGSISRSKKFSIYDMAIVGVMAAICFVVTYFIKLEVPTPAGTVMIKLANGFCLLAGVLFGGLRGGLAAGFGSMFYDLLDPKYIMDAPLTLIRFFLMACICGLICWSGKHKGDSIPRNLIGTSAGAVFSLAFYFVQSIIKQLFLGQPFDVAVVQCSIKMGVSTVNAVVGIVVACLLAIPVQLALRRAGLYQKLSINGIEGKRVFPIVLLFAGVFGLILGVFQLIGTGSIPWLCIAVIAAAALVGGAVLLRKQRQSE